MKRVILAMASLLLVGALGGCADGERAQSGQEAGSQVVGWICTSENIGMSPKRTVPFERSTSSTTAATSAPAACTRSIVSCTRPPFVTTSSATT